jgi:hypothetical protein
MTSRAGLAARLFVASLLLARLGGLMWMPPAPVSAAVLLAMVALESWRSRRGRWGSAIKSGGDYRLALLALLLLTVLVRLPSIGADLGHQPPDIDGHRLAANIRQYFLTGEIEHRTVEHYPGVVFWAMSASALALFFLNLMSGAVKAIEYTTVEQFMLAGRLCNVAIAAGIVACTAAIARRLSGRAAALVAAAVVSLAPLSLETTTDTRNDPGQVLLVLAAVLASLVAREAGGRWAVFAGTCAGLATGVKYTSVFVLVPAIIAVCGEPRERRVRDGLAAIAAFVVALAISNHFVWWDFPNFLRQLSDQVIITGATHWAASANPSAMHRAVLATVGPGWPLLVLAAAWGAWVLATAQARPWILWSFPLLYSWFTTHRPAQFPRWVFPLLPFVAIAGACGLMLLVRILTAWPRWQRVVRTPLAHRAAVACLSLVAIGPAVWGGAGAVSRRVQPTTAVLLERWLREHVDARHVVLIEDGWLDLRDVRFGVLRVPDLGWALAPNRHAIEAADWIVVPETAFARVPPGLVPVFSLDATPRTFGGRLGFDYRVYTAPRTAPALSAEVALDAPESETWVGWRWGAPVAPAQGRVVPERQGWVFVPAVASSRATLALDIAGGPASSLPVDVFVAGRQMTLAEAAAPAHGVRRLTADVGSQASDRALPVLIEPVPRGARVRLLRLRLE